MELNHHFCLGKILHSIYLTIRLNKHSSSENFALLGYYAAHSGDFLPTFRDNLWIPSSAYKNPKFWFLIWIIFISFYAASSDIFCRRFGTTYGSLLQRSRIQIFYFWFGLFLLAFTQRVVVFFADVSGQPMGPFFSVQESEIFIFYLDYFY